MSAAPRANGGFALIGALFVLVVLAALGAFAVRTNDQHDAVARTSTVRVSSL